MNFDRNAASSSAKAAASTAAVLGCTAALVSASARRSERAHPAQGRFISVGGVRVHVLDEGSGPPVVLIHGNAMSSQDYVASGIVERLVEQHRVIVIDRPGFGYTERPRGTDWTPLRQAALLHHVLQQLDVVNPVVVGHSLGALVAVAFALANPNDVRGLVLLSGYYYSSTFGIPVFAIPTLPVVGDVMHFTLAPILARATSDAMVRKLFAPAPVTASFARYPLSMSRRPGQIRAATEDANYMEPAAKQLQGRYGQLAMPVEILAGDGDAIVDTRAQSERLAHDVPNARFDIIEGAGHMIHYIAPDRIVSAIASVAERSRSSHGVEPEPLSGNVRAAVTATTA